MIFVQPTGRMTCIEMGAMFSGSRAKSTTRRFLLTRTLLSVFDDDNLNKFLMLGGQVGLK